MNLTRSILSWAMVATVAGAATAAIADEIVIIPGRLLQPDGSLASGQAVVIENGVIKRIAPASEFAGRADVLRHPDAVLSPGLIALNTSLGMRDSRNERLTAIDPTLRALDAVDAASAQFSRALRAGVTAAMVMPVPGNVVAGGGATVRTWSDDGSPDVIRPFGPISIVLAQSALDPSREPTSRAGAIGLLREALSEAKSSPESPMGVIAGGTSDVFVTCDGAADVAAALPLLGQYKLRPVIAIESEVRDIAPDLAGTNALLILGPLELGADDATLACAGLLAAQNVTVAFSGAAAANDPASIRQSAALAVRAGMNPDAARMALTVNAADAAGVGDRIGAVRQGLDADLVLFSNDPLRPDARVLEVWIKGTRVASPPAQEAEDKVIGATDDE